MVKLKEIKCPSCDSSDHWQTAENPAISFRKCNGCDLEFEWDKKLCLVLVDKTKEDDSSPDVDPSDICSPECPIPPPPKIYNVCEVVCMQNVVTVRLKDPAEAIRFAMKMLEEKE